MLYESNGQHGCASRTLVYDPMCGRKTLQSASSLEHPVLKERFLCCSECISRLILMITGIFDSFYQMLSRLTKLLFDQCFFRLTISMPDYVCSPTAVGTWGRRLLNTVLTARSSALNWNRTADSGRFCRCKKKNIELE